MTPGTRRRRGTTQLERVLSPVVVGMLGVGLLAADAYVRTADPAWAEGERVLPDGIGWLAAVLVVAQAAALALTADRPRVTLLVVTALDAGTLVLSAGDQGAGGIAVMVATYRLRRADESSAAWRWITVAALASAVVAAASFASSATIAAEWAIPLAAVRLVITFLIPAVVAEVVATRARLFAALQERAELAERERESSARAAVQQERALMARELHDIAAHHLSGIVLSAQAATALLPGDPTRALEYVGTVRDEAQHTLANLRQAVGLLRTQEPGELAPVPLLEQLPGLVASLRAAGMQIAVDVEGEPVPLGPLAETAAFRMVQESLTNARAHAPGVPARVSLRYAPDGVDITVTNGPATTSPEPGSATRGTGNGLLGMRERASLLGGALETGPTVEGGWRNRLTLPLPDPEPTVREDT